MKLDGVFDDAKDDFVKTLHLLHNKAIKAMETCLMKKEPLVTA